MSKYRTIVALIIGLVGVLAITTQVMAVSWGYVKCLYGPHPEQCKGTTTADPGDNKNNG